MAYYAVALPILLPEPLTYQSNEVFSPGDVVRVPCGNRMLWGVIWPTEALPREARVIEKKHASIKFSKEGVEFLHHVQQYTMMPLGLLIKLALPTLRYDFPPKVLYRAVGAVPKKGGPSLGSVEEWVKMTHSRTQTVLQWIEKELLQPCASLLKPHILPVSDLSLLPAQQEIVNQWQRDKPYLIQGVTGSGKTEVGLSCAQEIWKKGQQVLILVPEISLCSIWEKRLMTYFDISIALWHSGLSRIKKQMFFEDIVQGHAPVIIGARSALFLPYPDLGLIVIDEEHDPSYKQEERACYHARDMAVLRSHHQAVPTLLLSATPSTESLWNVHRGSYQHGHLTKRYHPSTLPLPTFIDMRPFPATMALSEPLRQLLKETFLRKEQSLLFLNRRGYAPLLLCYACGHRESCPHCSVCLTVHGKKKLLCHYCGFEQPLSDKCSHCQHETLLMPGLGIEKLYDEVITVLPEAKIALVSSDVSFSDMAHVLKKIEDRQIDVIIGTQLISKGYHFPYLTTVGIVDTDFALGDLDLRAQERLYQVISQVIGRAGRQDHTGIVQLQTFQPDHPFFQHLTEPENFFKQEMDKRHTLDLPPFTRLAAVVLSGLAEADVQQAADILKKKAPRHADCQILGPTPAPLNPLRRHYRWRFLLKATRPFPLQLILKRWLDRSLLPKNILCQIDMDPHSFM